MSERLPLLAEQLPAVGGRVLVEREGKSIAVFNVDGCLYAIDDSCPHLGASLCGGRLAGRVIQCCAHGLRFDLASGYLLNSNKLKVASYPVEWADGQAFILIQTEETAP